VRVAGKSAGEFNYAEISSVDLQQEFRAEPLGANHVIEKRKSVQDIVDFITIVAKIPQAAELLDYEAMILKVMSYMDFDEPASFIKKKEDAVKPETPMDAAMNVGGKPAADALSTAMQVDGGNALINQLKDSYGKPTAEQQPVGTPVSNAVLGVGGGDVSGGGAANSGIPL